MGVASRAGGAAGPAVTAHGRLLAGKGGEDYFSLMPRRSLRLVIRAVSAIRTICAWGNPSSDLEIFVMISCVSALTDTLGRFSVFGGMME